MSIALKYSTLLVQVLLESMMFSQPTLHRKTFVIFYTFL